MVCFQWYWIDYQSFRYCVIVPSLEEVCSLLTSLCIHNSTCLTLVNSIGKTKWWGTLSGKTFLTTVGTILLRPFGRDIRIQRGKIRLARLEECSVGKSLTPFPFALSYPVLLPTGHGFPCVYLVLFSPWTQLSDPVLLDTHCTLPPLSF